MFSGWFFRSFDRKFCVLQLIKYHIVVKDALMHGRYEPMSLNWREFPFERAEL